MDEKFSRTEMLIGNEGMKKLNDAKVAIFGLGGVGSFVCEGLARSGIGNFILVEKKLGDKIPKHPDVVVSIDFPVTAHALRRTYITRLILGGVDLRRVQYLAGHETPEITLEYYTDLMGHQPEDLIGDVRGIFDGSG